MNLSIEQDCPSCGASIILHEDDRLVQCSFCDVHNYKVGSVAGRFALPAKELVKERELIYAPYLRFKGSIFYVRNKEVKHKIVDTTRAGLDASLLPASLGLRPQAMQVKPVVSKDHNTFLIQSVPTKKAFVHAARVFDLFNDKSDKPILHRAFIGETLSRIYQPYYLKGDQLYDGVDNRLLGNRSLLGKHLGRTCTSKISWDPQFISTICPKCGGLLAGERDSLVLQCRNCVSLWQEKKQKFAPVDWRVVPSEDPRVCYLPFWQIAFSTAGQVLKNYGDYLRFTNQPVVSKEKHESRPLIFWIPAFKINPKAFLQLASHLTVSQHNIPEGKARRLTNGYPVTLDQHEAAQAIKIVLAQTTLSKAKRLPLLAKVKVAEVRCLLTYLPFQEQTHDLLQEHTLASLQTAAIRYGRTL